MAATKQEYEQMLRDYDKVGAELDDAKEDGSGSAKIEELRKKLDELGSKINAYERQDEAAKPAGKFKPHRYTYFKGYKKLKHVKLFEQFEMSEGTAKITEPVILLAINSDSAEDFVAKLEAYKAENSKTYVTDVTDAQHRLGLPLNAENDPKLIYDKTKEISK